jgi:hypothetical protein
VRPSRPELRRSRVAGSGTATEVEEDSDEPVCETPPAPLVLPSSRHPTKRKRSVRAKIESFIKFFITFAPFFNTFIITETIGSYWFPLNSLCRLSLLLLDLFIYNRMQF